LKNLIGIFIALMLGCNPAFAEKVSVSSLVIDRTTTGAGTTFDLGGTARTYYVYGSTTAGAGACAMKIEVSNNGASFALLATVSLTLSTTVSADGFASTAPWKYVRGNVDSISGTGAKCSLLSGSTGK
jgi:hypothetical protein